MFTDSLDVFEIWVRLLVAIGCGGLVGWEREAGGKAAGFRTHILVSMGAASFTVVAALLYVESALRLAGAPGDPTRVIQGVITGIGFLGAGAILRANQGVQGLTTAASVWVAGAIGVASGAGAFPVAGLITVHALVVLAVLKAVEHWGQKKLDRMREENGDAGGDSAATAQ